MAVFSLFGPAHRTGKLREGHCFLGKYVQRLIFLVLFSSRKKEQTEFNDLSARSLFQARDGVARQLSGSR